MVDDGCVERRMVVVMLEMVRGCGGVVVGESFIMLELISREGQND
jgi:hypothetical protein